MKDKGERPISAGFEDLEVWKRSAGLSADVYAYFEGIRDYGLKEQIKRSGLSVPSNIAEGFERESQEEFVDFLSYAKGFCGELRTQIYIGMEINCVEKRLGLRWLKEANEISPMRFGLIKARHGFMKES